MVQLRSCYFCGTAEAVTEYETLPNALQTDERSQRVALCDRCQTKLTTIMTPVVEALDAAPSRTSTHEGDTRRSRGDPVATRSTATSDESTEQAAVTFSDDADDADDADETDERDDRATEEAVEDVDEIHDAAETDEAAESADVTQIDESDDDDADDVDETAAEPTDLADAEELEDRGGDELDVVYHKLLRFLRNREFPIPRTEAETVAQSAYDLSASDAATVIQRAVDRGVLEERDGELHRR